MSGWRRRLLHGHPAQPSAELKRQFQRRDHTEHSTDLGTESQLLSSGREEGLSPSSPHSRPPCPPGSSLPGRPFRSSGWLPSPGLCTLFSLLREPALAALIPHPSSSSLISLLPAAGIRGASWQHPAPVLLQLQLQSAWVCRLRAVCPASLNPSFLSL